MAGHPENSENINNLMEHLAKNSDTCKVWCKGCQDFTVMNARYAAIIKTGEIEQCSRCR